MGKLTEGVKERGTSSQDLQADSSALKAAAAGTKFSAVEVRRALE